VRFPSFIPLLVCLGAATLQVQAKPRLTPIVDAITEQSSNPERLVTAGSQVYFTANDGVHGTELWHSDGTEQGTGMVIDLRPGPDPSYVALERPLGNIALFRGMADGKRQSLWRSDGTAAGTYRLYTYPPQDPNYNGPYVTVVPADTRVFMIVQPVSAAPKELWVSEGQVDDARLVAVFTQELGAAIGANGKLLFVASDPTLGPQFFITDGSLLNTLMVYRSVECAGGTPCGPIPSSFFKIGQRVCFINAQGLWCTDGTAAGTVKLIDATNAYLRVASDDVAYLSTEGRFLRTDGTPAGTTVGGIHPLSPLEMMILDDGRLVYRTIENIRSTLWVTDGGAARALATSDRVDLKQMVGSLGTRVYESAWVDSAGYELVAVDVDTGERALVANIDERISATGSSQGPTIPVSSDPGPAARLGQRLLFPATDVRGREPWITDGTPGDTSFIMNIAPEPAGGRVSGTVTDEMDGSPVESARVYLCATVCTSADSAGTDIDGHFRFEGVTPGTYALIASSPAHLGEVFDGNACPPCDFARGTPVIVQSGYETEGVNFTLARAGRISGTVRQASTGAPISYADVRIRWTTSSFYEDLVTDSEGKYQSGSLVGGNYVVEVQAFGYGGGQVYPGTDCPDFPCAFNDTNLVAVTTGVTTTGIDFALREFGTITGRILDASNGNGVGAASVEFRRADAPGSSASTTTRADGSYESPPLKSSSYYVTASGKGLSKVAHPNVTCPASGCELGTATGVPVSSGNATANIDISLSPVMTRLTGRITDADGNPLGAWAVSLLDTQGNPTALTPQIGAESVYVFAPIPVGTYYLKVGDEIASPITCTTTPCNLTGATPIVVAAGTTNTFDFRARARMVKVSGRVLAASTGALLSYANVRLYDSARLQIAEGTFYNGFPYSITTFSRSTSFYVVADAAGYAPAAYPDVRAACLSCVPDTAPSLPAGTHANIDISLARFGTITGRVTERDTGGPLQDVRIRFVSTANPSQIEWVYTGGNGIYEWIKGEGSYYIEASNDQYVGQVHPGRDCSGTCIPQSGSPATVAMGGVTVVDFQLLNLQRQGKISGRVVDDATGLPLAGVAVYAVSGTYSRDTVTDVNGDYTLGDYKFVSDSFALKVGSYKLRTFTPSHFISVYGGSQCAYSSTCNFNGGSDVIVSAGQTTTGINFRLIRLRLFAVTPASGRLSGGTAIVIDGANFTAEMPVMVGTQPAQIRSRTSTRIVAIAPPASEGYAHITVGLPSYRVSLPQGFRYTRTTFTDDALIPPTTIIRAAHVVELRQAINILRSDAGLAPTLFTDPILSGLPMRRAHFLELRVALNEARIARGLPPLTFANPLTAGTPVRAADVSELRDALR